MLEALIENLGRLQAEESLEMAGLLNLFTKNPDSKKIAAEMRRKQDNFIRQRKRIIDKAKMNEVERPPVEAYDPAMYFDDERTDIKTWFAEQGIETQ